MAGVRVDAKQQQDSAAGESEMAEQQPSTSLSAKPSNSAIAAAAAASRQANGTAAVASLLAGLNQSGQPPALDPSVVAALQEMYESGQVPTSLENLGITQQDVIDAVSDLSPEAQAYLAEQLHGCSIERGSLGSPEVVSCANDRGAVNLYHPEYSSEGSGFQLGVAGADGQYVDDKQQASFAVGASQLTDEQASLTDFSSSSSDADHTTTVGFGSGTAQLSDGALAIGLQDFSSSSSDAQQSTTVGFGSGTGQLSEAGLTLGLRDFSLTRTEYQSQSAAQVAAGVQGAIASQYSLDAQVLDVQLTSQGATLGIENANLNTDSGYVRLVTASGSPILATLTADADGNISSTLHLSESSALQMGSGSNLTNITGHDSTYGVTQDANGDTTFSGTNVDINSQTPGGSFQYTAGHTVVSSGQDGSVYLKNIENASASAVFGGHTFDIDIPLLNEFLFQKYQIPEMTNGAGFEFIPTSDSSRLSFRVETDFGVNFQVDDAAQFFAYATSAVDQFRVRMSDPTGQGNVQLELGPYIKVEGSNVDILAVHHPYDAGKMHRNVLAPLLMELNGAEAGIHWEPAAGVISIQTPGPLFLGFKILHDPLVAGEAMPNVNTMSYLLNAGTKFYIGDVETRFEGLTGLTSATGLELFSMGDGGFELFNLLETPHLAVPTTVSAMGRLTMEWAGGDGQNGMVFLAGISVNPTHMSQSEMLSAGPPSVLSAGFGLNLGALQIAATASKGTNKFGGGGGDDSEYETNYGFQLNWSKQF